MKEIPLTQGQVALVDDEDFERVNQYKWHALLDPNTGKYYAKRRDGNKNTFIIMHRFIMSTPQGLVCDHINGNTLDNRKCNLRNCHKVENNWNRGAQKNNSLGLKNITYRKDINKYRVIIGKNGKTVFDAHFKSLQDAINARNCASKMYHGEYSNTGE